MDSLYRHWQMLRMIPRYPRKIDGATIEALLKAQGYEVTRRTIQRDLEKLSGIFPLQCDDQNKPFGWSWQKDADGFSLPGMEPATALTLRLAEEHLTPLVPPSVLVGLRPYFNEAARRLDSLNDNPLHSWPEKVRVLAGGQPLHPPTVKDEVLNVVYDGLLRERRLSISYRRRGEEKSKGYEVSPLGLVCRNRLFYLVATLWDYTDPVLLLLHRMEEAELLDKEVEPPEGFSLDEYIAAGELHYPLSSRKIRLEMVIERAAGAHLLETPLADDQATRETEDGRLRLRATVQDTEQLRWWLLSFGDKVEILKPKRLRDKFRTITKNLASSYGGP